MKIAIKEVGKDLQIVETDKKYRTECDKEYTGKDHYVDFVQIGENLLLGVNEDGLALELPINFLLGTTCAHFPIQKMVGTVVFIRTKPVNGWDEIYDYEVDDLTDEDIARIEHILSSLVQSRLRRQFCDYGKGAMVVEPLNAETLMKMLGIK